MLSFPRSLVSAAALTLACSGGSGDPAAPDPEGVRLRVATDRPQYAAPVETRAYANLGVSIRVTNLGTGVLGYTLCSTTLERRHGDRWAAVAPQPRQPPCAGMRFGLWPGASADAGALVIPSAPGTYRYRLDDVTIGDSSTPVSEAQRVTDPFEVTGQ